MDTATARRIWFTLEPIHAMIYFAPEAAAAYAEVGVDDGAMGYFASRSAAMGPVPAEVVIATFFNFCPRLVRSAIPAAWEKASPAALLDARQRAVDDVAGSPEVAEAAALVRRAIEGVEAHGRPLYGGHACLPWPDEPHVSFWHGLALTREHRGDGHIAALVAAGVSPLDALILHGASGEVPTKLLRLTRGWSEEEWAGAEAGLRERGLIDGDGALTDEGTTFRASIEEATDRAALGPWDRLGDEGGQRLLDRGTPRALAVVDAGGAPFRRRR
jgi:hypothetical protein